MWATGMGLLIRLLSATIGVATDKHFVICQVFKQIESSDVTTITSDM